MSVPAGTRTDDHEQGHWLLAKLGKRVLRPGGAELTTRLLRMVEVRDADVLELAPGLGHTATEILAGQPHSYRGVDAEPGSVAAVQRVVGGRGAVSLGSADKTGLAEASVDVVIGEAMLTMQGERAKDAIVAEAVRVLRPGGRYAIHELSLTPSTVPEDVKTDVRQALARSIKVNARPLTEREWRCLLARHGLVVEDVATARMALLQPRRIIADEGVRGALRFAVNLARNPGARARVLAMRRTFHTHRRNLGAIAIVARKPLES